MNARQFERFLADCLDPDSPRGRALLAPRRVRTEDELKAAQLLDELTRGQRNSRPLVPDAPEALPPCF